MDKEIKKVDQSDAEDKQSEAETTAESEVDQSDAEDKQSEAETTAESGIEEDVGSDIFEDAKEHLEQLMTEGYNFEDAEEYLDKDSIFKEPPGLLELEEYKIAVAKFIANGISWNDTASVLFQVARHSQVEKTVRQLYFTALAEEVQHEMAELITAVCCDRNQDFPDALNSYKQPSLTSKLWEDILDLTNEGPTKKPCLLQLQLKNLKDVEYEVEEEMPRDKKRKDKRRVESEETKIPRDKWIQKLWKKTVASWLQLINTLVPHFFDDSVERELLSCIFNWFSSGDMSHSQLKKWKSLYKQGKATNLEELKHVAWEDKNQAKEHVSLFKSLLDDVETAELTRIADFEQMLAAFLTDPIIQLIDGNTRLQVIGKGFFLSDIVKKILEKKMDSIKEINIYSKYFLGIDCSLENQKWHGMNFTIVTDKLTVWKTSTIDVSGTGYSRNVRESAAKGSSKGKDGDDGVDGKAGESSGNVVILTNQLKNPKKLTIKLNGGAGEGGQNGGAGADGREGIKITKSSFLSTILRYRSLYRDSWLTFANYNPGRGWTEEYGKTINGIYQKWIYKTYKQDDGREMIYSFTGDCGWTYNTYDILFLIKGTDGSMGGSGGQNGVSGEGGNAGDFKARSLKTGAELKDFGQVEIKKGEDGLDGKPGCPGNPGENGNDMAMVDHSSGGWSWDKRAARYFHGESEKDRLQIAYEYSQSPYNALNGYRKHEKECSDCYTTFSADGVREIGHRKATEQRTASERTSKSQAVSKQTISIETLLEEFAEVCEGDELTIGDISDFKKFEAEEDEEEEKEEQVQEEISVIRTLVEDSQEHEKNLRRSIIKPEEVIDEIKKAANNLGTLTLVDLISLWKKIFSVPLPIDQIETELTALIKLICDGYTARLFKGHRTLSNGMSQQDVSHFINQLKDKLSAKAELSALKMKLNLEADGSKDLQMIEEELSDVVTTHLDTFWMEVNADNYKTELIQPLFKQIRDNDLHSIALLKALYKVNLFLKKRPEIFKPFVRDSFNWADIPLVQSYLQSFLSEAEKKAIAVRINKEKKEAEEKAKKEKEQKKAAKELAKASKTSKPGSPEPIEEHSKESEPEVGQEAEIPEIFAEKEESSLYSYLSSMISGKDVSAVFRAVAKEFKDEKTTESAFSDLLTILNSDRLLAERFCIEKNTVRQTLKPPGTSPQSLVHMFFLSEQILNYNTKLYRYYLSYEKRITIPNDWHDPRKETAMSTVADLILWAADLETRGVELPRINSDMHHFMLTNGLHCRAYRQMVADEKEVNIQMFCESGYSKMRLVESLNPEYVETQRLIIKDGGIKSIGVNEPLRKLRAVMDTVRLNIPLPQSSGPLQLAPYFPDSFESKVLEWTEAVIVATGSEMLPRFLQRLFELRGNSMSIVDLQFTLNTLIEANRNFNVPLDALCNRILTKDGSLLDIFLALRVLGAMKGTAPKLDPLVVKLFDIKDTRLKALFGSKLHEIPITDEVLTSLINMLAHAEDKVAQLEKLELKEWVNIAQCQKWNSYAPLLKAYGTVGYYIVLLDAMGNEQGQRLERIIKKIKDSNEKVIILEKFISMLTFLISNNEVEFNDKYEEALSCSLQLVSEKCVEMNAENIEMMLRSFGLRKEDVDKDGSCIKSETINLITNEALQSAMIDHFRMNTPILDLQKLLAVLPEDDRMLQDLIRLSINPQDPPDAREIRQAEMKEIGDMLAGRISDDLYGQQLKKIDERLFEIYGKKLRDTQKIAILSAAKSQKNLLSQVNTGEGKSFIISCLAILRILINPEDTVDIITSSSVLAQRDAESMKKLYEAFEIEVGHNCDEDIEKRKLAYKCGVVYGDIARFERDYLLQTFYKKNILGSRTRCNVIVDEVDSMLLDNGSNMLYLSHNVPGLELLDSFFVYLHKMVNTPAISETDAGFSSSSLRQKILGDMCGLVTKEDMKKLLFDEKNLTSVGKVWRILITQNVIDSEGVLKENWDTSAVARELKAGCGPTLAGRVLAMLKIVTNRRQEIAIPAYLKQFVMAHLDEFIKNAKQGLFLKHNDEYVVDLDRTGRVTDLHPVITIIDKGTGTDLSTSQWSEGLHQFLQLKHGCRLTPISLKAVFVSNVSYLKEYKRLNGFSGTLGSVEESKSLVDLYNADLLKIPTWKPKNFNENAPVLSKTKESWVKDIFDEICDQVVAKRSVLVICQSIAKVEELHKEFQRLYKKISNPSPAVEEAFGKVTVYTREFDEVDFTTEGELPCCRIIISTNLAGRGTDIALSDDLAERGGLHVIVSFLPENSRIENQAYGRAARCGQPGSGQIICLVQEEDNGANNIFQLKQFRDNAEVHRLRSLKQFYDYHIAVEETALNLFKDHCSVVMESVHSASEDPTIMQVIYFSLLDEWAAWLDSKAEEIKQCEKNKNDVLKDHIIRSVKGFLEAHPLPKIVYSKLLDIERPTVDYSESLKWIRCPQPLLSIALVHLEQNETDKAMTRLNEVSENYPDFEAEACYYKGFIEQQRIREALQHQAVPEKDENGKMVEGETGIRLGTINWLMREVLYSDDAPDELVQHCMAAVNKATEYFLLSRSLFATRIRKKHDMVRIVKMLQQQTSQAGSRGFAAQQEEAIAVLECFIGSIDDILGHRAKAEDVKIGDEDPHLTVRRFRRFVKKADIITPPQLAKKISDQQIHLLSLNHCLPVSALQFGFQQIYDNELLTEYDGQKIIRAEELAEVFPLPSVQGFWESLRRAGCFLAEQVFIAVKKADKKKVPVLKDIQSIELKLNPLQVQLSTEDLTEYDLYDVHGPAAAIRENDAKNAELQEAQEAGLIHLEVIATINPLALTVCQNLDQFSFLTIGAVSAELQISDVEAGWIMDTLVEAGVVERRLAEIDVPPTPEEIDAMNRARLEQQEKQENGEKQDEKGEERNQNGTASSAEDSGVEEDKVIEKKPKETCIAYFPISRICCDRFPSNMRSSIQMMLTRNFCYHYALTSLKSSFLSVVEGKPFKTYQICLPTDPYADLCEDLQNLGVVQHSRVTSALTDVYKPQEEEGIMKYGKRLIRKQPNITHYINPVIYKRLEPMGPKLCTRKCDLVATSAYLDARNVPASGEVRKAVSNGLRKVAYIQEKNWWKWALGVFLKVVAVLVPLMLLAACVFPVILPYVLIALAIFAVVGTILFCMSLFSQNQTMASTLNLEEEEEFHMLRQYHESALDAPKREKLMERQRKQIEKTSANFIQSIICVLDRSTRVTSSDEDISLWAETLEQCAQNSTHLPLLQRSVELWFKSNSRKIQESQFNGIFNRELNSDKKLSRRDSYPLLPFAFSSILISEVNRRKKTRERRKKAISTKLNISELPIESDLAQPTKDCCPLSFALSKTLKNLLTPIVEENIAAVIDPTLNGIDAAWRKNREDKIKPIEQEDASLKKRQIQHSAERLAKEQTVDFLATDLHNIFTRIAFREVSRPMLQHMVRYNYPLSPHCAKAIFDACVTILQSVDNCLKQVDIELKRNEQTIFTYKGEKDGSKNNKELVPLTIGLENDSFYVLEVTELTKDHRKYHHGLFPALQEYSNKFSDNFGLDPQSFVDKLRETVLMEKVSTDKKNDPIAVEKGLDKRWKSTVSWNGNEKLKCAVAI